MDTRQNDDAMIEKSDNAAAIAAEAAGAWVSPTCSLAASLAYCAACGERRPHPHELTLTGLCKQALEAFTSYDSRLLQTYRKLILDPGALTQMYIQGSRKVYLGPFGIFLLANVLFVAMEAIAGSNAFSTPLAVHLGKDIQPWWAYARELVNRRLAQSGTTLESYAPVFDQAVAGNSKSFIIVMVVPMALMTALLFSGLRRPFATHLAYALHFHSFMLTFMSYAMFAMWIGVLLGGQGMASQLADDVLSSTLLLVCAFYLYLSARKVYREKPYLQILQAVALTAAAMGIFPRLQVCAVPVHLVYHHVALQPVALVNAVLVPFLSG